MIELNLISQRKLPKGDFFLWRYLDIHKFLDFLRKKRFLFARMDQFEDVLEGVPVVAMEAYMELLKNSKISLAELGLSYSDNSALDGLDPGIKKIVINQVSHYVSCWFMEQRESMAMWNLYSNPESVAIRVSFQKLKNLLIPDLSGEYGERYIGGKVSYQNFISEGEYFKMKVVALRKDLSFQHEKEFRFVVKFQEVKPKVKSIFSVPLDLTDLDLQVVCHPQMKSWQKENIKELLELYNIGNSYQESEIRLR